jgi:hypothetical protein
MQARLTYPRVPAGETERRLERRGWIRPQRTRSSRYVSLSCDAAGAGRRDKEPQMPRYLISFGASAMDHIPDEDMPAVVRASHAVVDEAMNAGVWVFGGGLEHEQASIVATDGRVAAGPYPEPIGGFCVVDVTSREEALKWAAKTADACRCAQEVRVFMPDSAVGN